MIANTSLAVRACDAPTLPTLPGWVLEKALAAERASGFPFLASLLEATASRQRLAIALLALHPWPEIRWRLEAAGERADPQLLFKAPERLIARHVTGPTRGLLGSLRRMEAQALDAPEDYRVLLDLLTGEDRGKRQAVLYLPAVTSSLIQITGRLRHRNAPLCHQLHSLKLELLRELPSHHVRSPIPWSRSYLRVHETGSRPFFLESRESTLAGSQHKTPLPALAQSTA